jgi:protein-disulfide isomerase
MRLSSATLAFGVCLSASLGALHAQKPKPAPKPAPAKAESTPGQKSAFDKATMEAYVRHLFVWGPTITVKVEDPKPSPVAGFQTVTIVASAGAASQSEDFLVSKDGKHILQGKVYGVADSPFKDELSKLKTDLSPSFGAPGAPVVVVVFSDFECQYCKQEAKTIRESLPKEYPTQVRVYFKDFPLDAIHPWARQAAIAGRCVFRQAPAAFWDYHDWMFEHQGEINAETVKNKALEFAGTKKLDTLMLGQCIDTKATEHEVDKTVAEGKSLQVNSTPTMFLNGRKIPGSVAWPQLKQVIDFELEYQKTTADAGEKCCEVKLPSPVNK